MDISFPKTLVPFCFYFQLLRNRSKHKGTFLGHPLWYQDLKNMEDLKNWDLKNKDNLKIEEDLKIEDNLLFSYPSYWPFGLVSNIGWLRRIGTSNLSFYPKLSKVLIIIAGKGKIFLVKCLIICMQFYTVRRTLKTVANAQHCIWLTKQAWAE